MVPESRNYRPQWSPTANNSIVLISGPGLLPGLFLWIVDDIPIFQVTLLYLCAQIFPYGKRE